LTCGVTKRQKLKESRIFSEFRSFILSILVSEFGL